MGAQAWDARLRIIFEKIETRKRTHTRDFIADILSTPLAPKVT